MIVSGGGWAVGDLEGAAEEALEVPGATVVCLCGRNDELRSELARALRRRAPGAGRGIHRPDARLVRGRRRARPLDRRA